MPVLDDHRHELFAQRLAEGMSATAAHAAAGFKANRGNASTLKANQSIRARVAELQNTIASKVIERSVITKEWLLDMMRTNAIMAQEAGKFEASTSALKSLGLELHNMFVGKTETGTPGDFARMSDDELERFIAERMPEAAPVKTLTARSKTAGRS